MKKKEIRQEVFGKRQEMSEEEIKALSQRVFFNVREYLSGMKKERADLFAYFSCNHEVDTRDFLCEWLLEKRQAALPRVGSDGYSMEFYYINSLTDTEEGYKGIFEPKKSCMRVDDSKNSGIILVPGVGFDRWGNRVGYGKGFYDRYLAKHCFQKTIGIAFEFQMFDRIECEENDIRLDVVITEKQIYETI